MITPSDELVETTLERMFVGPCKESLSVVDHSLFVGDVCRVFGQFVWYDVFLLLQTRGTSALTREDTTQGAVKCKTDLQALISHGCQARKYSFCIKKCGLDSSSICKPVRMDCSVLDTLRHPPDPMINASDSDHYLAFEKAMLQDTNDKDYPSLQQCNRKKSISFSPAVQHVNNVGTLMQCEECQMWRLLLSKRKLTIPQRRTL